MLKRTYTEDEVNKLLSSVEAAFGAHLQKAEEELLTKSEAASTPAPEETPVAEELKKGEDEECDLDDEEKKELEKAYCEMSKAEQKAHMDMLKRAMGDDQPAEMQKSEQDTAKDEEFQALKKSQEELAKENEGLKQNVTDLVNALKKRFSSVPPQKSVTEIATIRKSEDEGSKKEYSKSEITEVLTRKAKDSELKKSDREAINQFYKTGSADITLIQHLLK